MGGGEAFWCGKGDGTQRARYRHYDTFLLEDTSRAHRPPPRVQLKEIWPKLNRLLLAVWSRYCQEWPDIVTVLWQDCGRRLTTTMKKNYESTTLLRHHEKCHGKDHDIV